jgi:hypothetical protein
MGLVFAPVATVVLGAVRPREAGQASGANNAIRELGGVFGVAVMATIFSSVGSYASAQAFSDGLAAAEWVGAAIVGVGALIALAIPRIRRSPAPVEAPAPSEASVPALAAERV